ncbi:hypothetical protein [Rhizobium leguminosarum]|uniref:hypothetical protein n=1 Tax=Rhizobium leguminosarum TaxID=384 RepID=UPI000FEC65AD|nr:hypothetical protein [Rhizobium leguminosarum]RWX26774.1 hypothetical protein EHI43_27625 [Rhizobium leguminosarum]
MQVVLRHRQVFVRVDGVLIEELEDLRRGDAVPVRDMPEVVEDPVGRRPIEAGSSPSPEQGGLQPFEGGGVAGISA